MPFLSSQEVLERTSSPDNLANRLSLIPIGVQGVKTRLPLEIQKTIALLASDPNKGETQEEIGSAFGVTQSVVSHLARGRTSHGESAPIKEVVQKEKDKNKDSREEAETIAIDTLISALKLVPDKLTEETKLKKITAVAKDMAIIAEKMGKREAAQGASSQVQLNIYVPRMKAVEEYEVIDIG